MYLGPPDYIHVDQGTNFTSQEFKAFAEAEGIKVMESPTESPSTMSHLERNHATLHAVYLKLRDTLGNSTSNDDCLELAVKAINDTVGSHGLFPTLLVFGTIPRPDRTRPAATKL